MDKYFATTYKELKINPKRIMYHKDINRILTRDTKGILTDPDPALINRIQEESNLVRNIVRNMIQ
jgi:hypothetical protein